MKMHMDIIIYISLLSILSLINSLPTFEITGISHTDSRCDYIKGYFQIKILGKGSGITEKTEITLPLKSPCDAACVVNSEEMFCTMDAYVNDLTGNKKVIVNENEPTFNNLKISNWAEYFIPERRTINDATNCWGDEDQIVPDNKDEHIYVVYETRDLEILGCFRDKNNFSFHITKVKDEKAILQGDLKEDIYFEFTFESPDDEKANCVIPKDENIARCTMDYGGKITLGDDFYGNLELKDKKYKILFRGLLIPPTTVDECH
jgi:hypothetical protein